MSVLVASLQNNNISLRVRTAIWVAVCFLSVVMVILSSMRIVAFIGTNGFASALTIDQQGLPNSFARISGGNDGIIVMGMGSGSVTLPATNVYMDGGTHAILNGNLSDLNGYPSATVWFEWGYNTSYGTVVGTQATAATGDFSYSLSHYAFDQNVHYRFVVDNKDGITYGDDQTFTVSGQGIGLASTIGYILLPLAILILAFIFMMKALKDTKGVVFLVVMMIVIFIAIAGVEAVVSIFKGMF